MDEVEKLRKTYGRAKLYYVFRDVAVVDLLSPYRCCALPLEQSSLLGADQVVSSLLIRKGYGCEETIYEDYCLSNVHNSCDGLKKKVNILLFTIRIHLIPTENGCHFSTLLQICPFGLAFKRKIQKNI